ncbi:hypothetical protein B0H14DRAFT_3888955 [Mycena olivaceomarginata]|nr:hypothetical protein B0H14DRAFT_3888955 [Mycena olivaceomarginata]
MDTTTTFLSRLDSFTGSVKNCVAVLPHARELRQLAVLFPADAIPRPFTQTVFPPHAFPGVTSLDARAVDPNGGTARYAWTFHPDSLICLADAFPNLTRLEVSLTGSLHDYCAGFAALANARAPPRTVHKHPPMSDYGRRAAELYPAEALAAEINFDGLKLGRLPVLAEDPRPLDVWWDLEMEYWFERRGAMSGARGGGVQARSDDASDEKEGGWGMIDV